MIEIINLAVSVLIFVLFVIVGVSAWRDHDKTGIAIGIVGGIVGILFIFTDAYMLLH